MSATSPLVLREQRDAVALLTLNQPEKRNALSKALLEQLHAALAAAEQDKFTRVVILKANGPVFSAGHDLKEMAASNKDELQGIFHLCAQVMELLPGMAKPVIAQVHALATAAGCQLVASCDLVVAAVNAQFATPGVKVGLFCTTPGIPLSRAIPAKKALEMLFTGEPISAEEACRLGLVNRVVPAEQLEEATLTLARKIAWASPRVIAQGKRDFYRLLALDRAAAYRSAEPIMVEAAASPDCQEGIAAFLGKRAPAWPEWF